MLYKVRSENKRHSTLTLFPTQAQENVRKASDLRDPNEKQNVLGESLRCAPFLSSMFDTSQIESHSAYTHVLRRSFHLNAYEKFAAISNI